MSTLGTWQPRTTGVLIGGLVLILVALVASYILRNFQLSTDLRLGSGVFAIQLATTEEERVQGLSGVDHLDANKGLLMVFPNESQWGIWMKDMKIPLDIIWMDAHKKVIYMVIDASPDLGTSKTFKPKDPALYVLEVPAGTIKGAGIKIGNSASFTVTEAN